MNSIINREDLIGTIQEVLAITKKDLANIIMLHNKHLSDINQIEKTLTITRRNTDTSFEIQFLDNNGQARKYLFELKKYS